MKTARWMVFVIAAGYLILWSGFQIWWEYRTRRYYRDQIRDRT